MAKQGKELSSGSETNDAKFNQSINQQVIEIISHQLNRYRTRYGTKHTTKGQVKILSDRSRRILSRLVKENRHTTQQACYSRTSMARTSLGPWKFVRDMGSSSHWGLIMAPVQEANSDNLGKYFQFSTQWFYVECRIASMRQFEWVHSTYNSMIK